VFARTTDQVLIYDAATGSAVGAHDATHTFTDMDLTLDGRYLFAADYGGERIAFDAPAGPHYVHRYDLATHAWDVQYTGNVAYRIEAVDRNHVLLQEGDQHVDMTYNYFADWPQSPVQELSRIVAGYYGDFEYDARTGFVYHGTSRSSSQEIVTRRIEDDTLIAALKTGSYGTAQGHGGSVVLSSDGKRLYYGKLQVEALNVRNNLRVFPEAILAATAQVAFGRAGYYDVNSGVRLGNVGHESSVWFASDDGGHVRAADADGKLHHYDIRMIRSGVLLNDSDANGDALQVDYYSQPTRGTVSLDPSGAFLYTPAPGFFGFDEFNYRVVDSHGATAFGTVRVDVHPTSALSVELDNASVSERVGGAIVGRLTVAGAPAGEALTFAVSDYRFEVRDGVLHLKASEVLDALLEPTISLTITVTIGDNFQLNRPVELTTLGNNSPWQNRKLAADVDDDGIVAPVDALIIINELHFRGPHELAWSSQGPSGSYLDTSGDGFVTAIDALVVINALNRAPEYVAHVSSVDAEAEAVEGPTVNQPRPENLADLALAWYLSERNTKPRKSQVLLST